MSARPSSSCSHSVSLRRRVQAGPDGPGVPAEAAEGLDDGRVGTSCDRVEAALGLLRSRGREGSGVIVLTDLGSATMTVESVIR